MTDISTEERYDRTRRLIGDGAFAYLRARRVAVFGLGGVGGHAAEALARGGIGTLMLIDSDTVAPSNLNRQIIATGDTVGQLKTEAMRARLTAVDPTLSLDCRPVFVTPETVDDFALDRVDYVVDAIDNVSAKIALAVYCHRTGTRLISCMGTGNKLDPSELTVADLFETSVCPLARVMRTELRRRGVPALKVVYSRELPRRADNPAVADQDTAGVRKAPPPASISFVPATAGLLIAGTVIRDLLAAGGFQS